MFFTSSYLSVTALSLFLPSKSEPIYIFKKFVFNVDAFLLMLHTPRDRPFTQRSELAPSHAHDRPFKRHVFPPTFKIQYICLRKYPGEDLISVYKDLASVLLVLSGS